MDEINEERKERGKHENREMTGKKKEIREEKTEEMKNG